MQTSVATLALLILAQSNALDWAREKVRAQSQPAPTTAPTKGLFAERSEKQPPINFRPPTSFAPLVKAVTPGVVNLSTANKGSSHSLGSGFLINAQGHLVTNHHVIARAESIRATLADGREFNAKVVGSDPSTDLALLRLEEVSGPLPFVFLGDSDRLEVGDWVVAIGNPFGLDTSVTQGIISARERVIGMGPYDDFIQTNTLINPGNSGGPLFDMRGDVVGVTTAVVNQAQGICFAVPINLVKDLLPNLLVNGRAERGWLGVNIQDVGADVVVTGVFKDSPAAKAGLKPGDRLLVAQERQVDSYQKLLRRIALLSPGTEVRLKVARSGKPLELKAELTRRPAESSMVALETSARSDQLGVLVREVSTGLLIEAVLPGSPAELSGLQAGDVVVELNREKLSSLKELEVGVGQTPKGQTLLIKVSRGKDSARYVALKPR